MVGYKTGYEVEGGHCEAGWEGVRLTSDKAWVGHGEWLRRMAADRTSDGAVR